MGIVTILIRARAGVTARVLVVLLVAALAVASLAGCTGGHRGLSDAAQVTSSPSVNVTGAVTLLVINTLSAPGFASPTSEELAAVTGAWACRSWDVASLPAPGVVIETHLLITRSRVPAARSVIGRMPRASVTQAEPTGFAVVTRTSGGWPPIDRGPC